MQKGSKRLQSSNHLDILAKQLEYLVLYLFLLSPSGSSSLFLMKLMIREKSDMDGISHAFAFGHFKI